MGKEILFRFLIGGAVVSIFAAFGGLFRPKSFAGVFGAAPSVATATLGLAISAKGALYAAAEARSMMLGAVALFSMSSAFSSVARSLPPPELLPNIGGPALEACSLPFPRSCR